MWPKAFAQFVELAPHISRLLPMADRFFQSKSTAEDGNRQAIEALGLRLQGEVDRVVQAQAEVGRQMDALSERVDRYASAVTKLSTEPLERRLTQIEAQQRRQAALTVAALVLLSLAVVLLLVLLLRGR